VWCRQQDGGHGSWNPRKECVTTHLQNHTAPKTDGAQAVNSNIEFILNILYPTLDLCYYNKMYCVKLYIMIQRVGGYQYACGYTVVCLTLIEFILSYTDITFRLGLEAATRKRPLSYP